MIGWREVCDAGRSKSDDDRQEQLRRHARRALGIEKLTRAFDTTKNANLINIRLRCRGRLATVQVPIQHNFCAHDNEQTNERMSSDAASERASGAQCAVHRAARHARLRLLLSLVDARLVVRADLLVAERYASDVKRNEHLTRNAMEDWSSDHLFVD